MADVPPAITIVRVFHAPRHLVFRTWLRAEDLSAWFAPQGFTVTGCEVDPRPGGRWQIEFRSADGQVHQEYGEFGEIVAPERLAFTLTQRDGHGNTGPETLVRVTFAEQGSKTEMTFEQTGFESTAVRNGNAEGWKGCFDKLDQHLSDSTAQPGSSTNAEQEIRREFEEWFHATAAKDLDAVMTKIAKDVVSYEHEAPLVQVGADAIREVCQRGFDAAKGTVRWDVPDLHVIVRGDIAVTWGLNHMQTQEPGREMAESWSRGTRVFQKIDGAWKLIHQHVSFPITPVA